MAWGGKMIASGLWCSGSKIALPSRRRRAINKRRTFGATGSAGDGLTFTRTRSFTHFVKVGL
ncbi:hypothetical protein shim_22240 [Shimia sp. SK013]|nr:hypothetical protein shim_22240 [Shimia sp. SK013]